jgi:hypothetical protein
VSKSRLSTTPLTHRHFNFMFLLPGVTILLSLTVFLNMVAETMPATSDAVPLFGKPVWQGIQPARLYLGDRGGCFRVAHPGDGQLLSFYVSVTTCVWSTVSLTEHKTKGAINAESNFNHGCLFFGFKKKGGVLTHSYKVKHFETWYWHPIHSTHLLGIHSSVTIEVPFFSHDWSWFYTLPPLLSSVTTNTTTTITTTITSTILLLLLIPPPLPLLLSNYYHQSSRRLSSLILLLYIFISRSVYATFPYRLTNYSTYVSH